eukprot:TRINITY_DN1408_c0_g2_i1.p1 TRINITY_DN1408_c0_g2~~TRINITY_DN1408_c0_g2_i1.p1  ORF type:complete len:323 (+),score=119.91 TRINITY_DN1408_c0_g2_i1:66-971(+)
MPEQGFLQSFIAGGAGGMCLVFVGHPLDTVKVKLQTDTTGQFKGTFDCVKQIVAKDGVRGLYRGMAAPIYGVTPMYALCFTGYNTGKRIFCDEDAFQKLEGKHLLQIAAAGAFSAVYTTPILAPGERLKCMLQVQSADNQRFKGPGDLGRHLWKESGGGIAGLRTVNRGFAATMTRDGVASAFYFSSYEYLKRLATPEGEKGPSSAATFVCGGVAGIFNWAFAIPFDTVKSKLQTDPNTFERYPNGMRSVVSEMVKEQGFGAVKLMYKGFTAVMLRAFPANAACFLGYETAVSALDSVGIH